MADPVDFPAWTLPNTELGYVGYVRIQKNARLSGDGLPLVLSVPNSWINQPRTLQVEGPNGVVHSKEFPATQDNQFVWWLNTTTIPDGNYVLTCDRKDGLTPFPVVIQNGTAPVRGPLVPVVTGGQLDEHRYANGAVKWIPWEGEVKIKGGKLRPRNHVQTSEDWNLDNLFVRHISRYQGGYSVTREWKEDVKGNIHIGYQQPYYKWSTQVLSNGNFRDGPYGVGALGSTVSARPGPDKSIIFTALNGSVKLVKEDGHVYTILGYRLPDKAPIPFQATVYKGAGFGWDVEDISNQEYVAKFELVGNWGNVKPGLNSPFFSCFDPDDKSIVWVCDTNNHRVLKVKVDPTTYVGTVIGCIGSAQGDEGDADGIGIEAGLARPRGIAFLNNTMYVTEAWNHCISVIDRTTLSRTIAIQSVKQHGRASQWIDHPEWTTETLRTAWEKEGPAGLASFNHPQQCQVTSTGKIRFATDHTWMIYDYDPVTNSIKEFYRLPDFPFQATSSYKHNSWISFDVDYLGVIGPKDTTFTAFWESDSGLRINPDGQSHRSIYSNVVGVTGGSLRVTNIPTYIWCVGVMPWGALIASGGGDETVNEISVKLPTDPVDITDNDKGIATQILFTPLSGSRLSLIGEQHHAGFDQLGGEQWAHWYTYSDEIIKTKLKTVWNMGPFSDIVIDPVIKWIRQSSSPSDPIVGGITPVDPPPPPPPVDNDPCKQVKDELTKLRKDYGYLKLDYTRLSDKYQKTNAFIDSLETQIKSFKEGMV